MGGNIPYQEYIENGYFRVKKSVYETNGQTRTYQQTFVTGKGQQYILSRLMREYVRKTNHGYHINVGNFILFYFNSYGY